MDKIGNLKIHWDFELFSRKGKKKEPQNAYIIVHGGGYLYIIMFGYKYVYGLKDSVKVCSRDLTMTMALV